MAFRLESTLITRIGYEATTAPTMAGSYPTVAPTSPAALDALGPLWAAAALVVAVLLLA